MMDRKAGFTLIELLVVISIIALLLSILMPSLGVVKKMAQGTACTANQRSLATAWFLYTGDHDDMFVNPNTWLSPENWVQAPQYDSGVLAVDGSGNPTADCGVTERENGIKKGALYPYTRNTKLYHCPGDERYKANGTGGYRSYSVQASMGDEYWSGLVGARGFTKYTQVRRPSEKYVFVEEMDGRGWNINSWVVYATGDDWIDPIAIWHNEKSTLGFADGHSEVHKWVDERTIEMAEKQIVNCKTPDNEDLVYMQKSWEPINR